MVKGGGPNIHRCVRRETSPPTRTPKRIMWKIAFTGHHQASSNAGRPLSRASARPDYSASSPYRAARARAFSGPQEEALSGCEPARRGSGVA
jgi:hypothetical protein